MEPKIKELLELKRMKEELEAEITSMEDEIKQVMGDEETLLVGAFNIYCYVKLSELLWHLPKGKRGALYVTQVEKM